ncbi:MAG: hypothetical protein FWD96_04805 [Defluviitaleaceae bacterium]|nr:hypothetical protein [Defluviitaleaceae bacterium]
MQQGEILLQVLSELKALNGRMDSLEHEIQEVREKVTVIETEQHEMLVSVLDGYQQILQLMQSGECEPKMAE